MLQRESSPPQICYFIRDFDVVAKCRSVDMIRRPGTNLQLILEPQWSIRFSELKAIHIPRAILGHSCAMEPHYKLKITRQ